MLQGQDAVAPWSGGPGSFSLVAPPSLERHPWSQGPRWLPSTLSVTSAQLEGSSEGQNIAHSLWRAGPGSRSRGFVREELSISCNLVPGLHLTTKKPGICGKLCVQLRTRRSGIRKERAGTDIEGIIHYLCPKHLAQRSSTKDNCYCCLFFEKLRGWIWKVHINTGYQYCTLDFAINTGGFKSLFSCLPRLCDLSESCFHHLSSRAKVILFMGKINEHKAQVQCPAWSGCSINGHYIDKKCVWYLWWAQRSDRPGFKCGLLYFLAGQSPALTQSPHCEMEQWAVPAHWMAFRLQRISDTLKPAAKSYYQVTFPILRVQSKRQGQKAVVGFPWWCRGKESTSQRRRHGFDPWSGKIPRAIGQLSLWATATEPVL